MRVCVCRVTDAHDGIQELHGVERVAVLGKSGHEHVVPPLGQLPEVHRAVAVHLALVLEDRDAVQGLGRVVGSAHHQ